MGSIQGEDTLLNAMGCVDYTSFADNASRRKALFAAQSLVRRLQHPVEAVWDVALAYPALYSALKVGIDLNLFAKLGSESGRPKTTLYLADGSDSVLVKRILRHLAAMSFIDEVDVDLWGPTRLSSALTEKQVLAHIDFAGDGGHTAFIQLPQFLKEGGYRDPTDATHGNWQSATSCDKAFFEWMAERPRVQQTFWDLMDGVATQPGCWTDVYPIAKILSSSTRDRPLVVDVGGAEGRDMQSLVQRFPEASGRVVLQDQEAVIKTISHLREEGVIPMAHDFFLEQSIKGARIYYLHRVLHDWYNSIFDHEHRPIPSFNTGFLHRPEDKAREILCNLKPAMAKGYSRLVINEIVLPFRAATSDQTTLDLTMMALVSGSERSEEDWRSLIESSGFRILGFYHSLASREAVIEAELV